MPTADEGEGSLGAVLALTSTDKMLGRVSRHPQRVMIAGLVSMLVALALSYALARGILRPVRKMALAAEQAAAGNYRTQIGLTGSDELARLSRAFDSLLSDLREKSDIEGYVGNLSRFLPDMPPEPAQPASARQPVVFTPAPAKSETLSVLGMEFRDLVPADSTAEQAVSRFSRVAATVEHAARSNQAVASEVAGNRFVLAFGGAQRSPAALRALAQVRGEAISQGFAAPAAGIVAGTVVRGGVDNGGHARDAPIGMPMLHLDRLLPEAPAGQTVLHAPGGR